MTCVIDSKKNWHSSPSSRAPSSSCQMYLSLDISWHSPQSHTSSVSAATAAPARAQWQQHHGRPWRRSSFECGRGNTLRSPENLGSPVARSGRRGGREKLPGHLLMVGLRHPDSCRALRASTSPSRAAWMALWSTMLDLGQSEQKWQGSWAVPNYLLSGPRSLSKMIPELADRCPWERWRGCISTGARNVTRALMWKHRPTSAYIPWYNNNVLLWKVRKIVSEQGSWK